MKTNKRVKNTPKKNCGVAPGLLDLSTEQVDYLWGRIKENSGFKKNEEKKE